MRNDAATFQRAHRLPRGAQFARDGMSGLGDCGLEIDFGACGQEKVVAPVLVHQCGIRLAGSQHIVQGRQLFQVELDLARDVFRFGPRRRDAHHHQLADVADFAIG